MANCCRVRATRASSVQSCGESTIGRPSSRRSCFKCSTRVKESAQDCCASLQACTWPRRREPGCTRLLTLPPSRRWHAWSAGGLQPEVDRCSTIRGQPVRGEPRQAPWNDGALPPQRNPRHRLWVSGRSHSPSSAVRAMWHSMTPMARLAGSPTCPKWWCPRWRPSVTCCASLDRAGRHELAVLRAAHACTLCSKTRATMQPQLPQATRANPLHEQLSMQVKVSCSPGPREQVSPLGHRPAELKVARSAELPRDIPARPANPSTDCNQGEASHGGSCVYRRQGWPLQQMHTPASSVEGCPNERTCAPAAPPGK